MRFLWLQSCSTQNSAVCQRGFIGCVECGYESVLNHRESILASLDISVGVRRVSILHTAYSFFYLAQKSCIQLRMQLLIRPDKRCDVFYVGEMLFLIVRDGEDVVSVMCKEYDSDEWKEWTPPKFLKKKMFL